jgi:hypothetical protein
MRHLAFISAAMFVVAGMACKPSPAPATSAVPEPPVQSAAQSASPAGGPASAVAKPFTGAIGETITSGGYTYLRLKNGTDEVWIAGPEFDGKVGEQVSVALDMPMKDFESKTLNRTFPLLYFAAEIGRNGQPLSAQAQPSAPAMMNSHGAGVAAAPVEKMAPPVGGLSIADVFAKKAALAGKPVTVRGKVVKFNGGIMDRNWLHIQDGSGAADVHDNDLTVTTSAHVKVGDVVTLTGVLGTDRDFGAGYAYDAVLEKATVGK